MRYELFAHFFAVCPCYRRIYQNLAYFNFHSTSLEARPELIMLSIFPIILLGNSQIFTQ